MVNMGRYPHKDQLISSQEIIEKALHQVNAWHLRDRLISQLSSGERQRVYIARSLATQAPIVLLDEPTTYLDLRHQLEIWHLLRQLVNQGRVIIVTVHDLFAAERFCDQLVILNQGTAVATGTYEKVMTPQLLRAIFGVGHHPASGMFELENELFT